MILLLTLVAIWPLAHRAWVHTSGISPWKFFGWAMYTTPRFNAQFDFRALEADDTPGPRIQFPIRRPDARLAMRAYRIEELAWARQTDTSGLARAIFAAYPSVDRLELTRKLLRYDPSVGVPIRDVDVMIFDREPH